MTFWDHVDELREAFIRCLTIFFAGFFFFYFLLSDHLLRFLTRPLFAQLPPERHHLYYMGLFENFFVHLRISGYASLIFLSPIYFLILWSFITPGLHSHERKNILPFVMIASLFFIFGASFAYFILFPAGVKYFLSYGTSSEVAWLTLEHYVSLILKILFGFGLCFELPVVIVLLAKIGLISPQTLASQRKTALIVVTLLAALVAPPDAVSMLLLMAPLYLLYEGSLIAAKVVYKNNLL